MSILICPECQGKVSDKAEICPHCGCPVNVNEKKIICKVNNIEYDFTDFYDKIINVKKQGALGGTPELREIIYDMSNLTDLASPYELCMIIAKTEEVPAEYNGQTMTEARKKQQSLEASKIKCPNCHSTNVKKISTTERATSVVTLGLLSKKINKSYKCLNCKYTW